MTSAENWGRSSTHAGATASTATSSQTCWNTNGSCASSQVVRYQVKPCSLTRQHVFDTASEMTEKPTTDKKAKDGASTSTEAVKVSVKKNQTFVPFTKALQHSFKSISAKKQKKMNAMLWATLG